MERPGQGWEIREPLGVSQHRAATAGAAKRVGKSRTGPDLHHRCRLIPRGQFHDDRIFQVHLATAKDPGGQFGVDQIEGGLLEGERLGRIGSQG